MSEEQEEIYQQKALHDPATLTQLIRSTVMETLERMGLDSSSPTELQADLYYLRRLRKRGEEVRSILSHAVLTLLASSAIYLLWHALKGAMKS